jgi:proliferating cell nuclear antigen
MSGYIIEAKTVQTGAIRTLTEALKCILVEMNFIFDKDGIRMVSYDQYKTMIIEMKMYCDKFENYVYNHKESSMIIGINADQLNKIIKTSTNDDVLTFFISDENASTLGIILENNGKKQITNYKLNLLDRDKENVEIKNKLTFNNHITMPSVDFQKICRDMVALGANEVEIKNIGNTMTFGCKGHFAKRSTMLGENLNENTFQKDTSLEIITGTYNLQQLILFTKCTNLCNNMEIHMKNEEYIMFRYVIANLGDIKLFLMPPSKS